MSEPTELTPPPHNSADESSCDITEHGYETGSQRLQNLFEDFAGIFGKQKADDYEKHYPKLLGKDLFDTNAGEEFLNSTKL